MNNRQSRGWSISTTFNVDQFRFEARFNTLNQGPSISIDNFIEAWLIDPTTPTRALTAAADDGSASINRQMRTWNGIESAYRIQPFSFLDNRWYRLVLAGGLNQNIRAALVADDAVTELVSRTFAFSTSIFPNGFSIGLGQSTGVPNKDSPLDVAIDYVRLTTVPEPPSSVVVLAAVVLGGRILFARRCKHANTTADHTANIKKQTTSILSPEP